MLKLNFPDFDYKVTQKEGKLWLWDTVRRKYVVLTPEEWVRQHCVHFLIQEKQVPSALVALELGHKYNQLSRRCDIVVWSNAHTPLLIVECKAPHIPLSDQTMLQLSSYYNSIRVPYLALTNGIEHRYYEVYHGNLKSIAELPIYRQMGSQQER